MKPHYKVVAGLLAGAVLVAALPAAAATIYTWVDQNGVRHYADHPGSPNARAITLSNTATMPAPAPASLPPLATSNTAAPAPRSARKPVPLTKAQEAKLCQELQAEVAKLTPARRVQVKEKNGQTRYLSGDDLVQYKQKIQQQTQTVCAAAGSGPGG